MYLEDDDLCKRLVDLEYKNAVLTTARIIHLEGKVSPKIKSVKIYYQSQNLYWQKHNGFLPTLLMRLIRLPYKILKTKIELCYDPIMNKETLQKVKELCQQFPQIKLAYFLAPVLPEKADL